MISQLIVLTAAHCVTDGKQFVRVGSTSMKTGGSRHKVIKALRHENYSLNPTSNDIALLRVDPPIVFDKTTPITKAPVQLIESNLKVAYGIDAQAIGWGASRERREGDYTIGNIWHELKSIFKSYDMGHYFSAELRCTTLKVVTEDMCRQKFQRSMENQICAYGEAKDTCRGDSGGPLMVQERQAGIVSWGGPTCGTQHIPGGYVAVADYRDWIDEKVEILSAFEGPRRFDWLRKKWTKINPFGSNGIFQTLKKVG
ncbi:hypothetical protein QAD02_003789 [Eretmocerus hayati]|uniref:Uncharacterized protein n=1 Tax=Eretmocerus hayati TaxID=131215 RepID=A0ACC2NMY0_9HYME|nr:hypothetical protein QAD02_003789 [Eretmocerus hayati]